MAKVETLLAWASNPGSEYHSKEAAHILAAAKGMWTGEVRKDGRGSLNGHIALPTKRAKLTFVITQTGKLSYASGIERDDWGTSWTLAENPEARSWRASTPPPRKADWLAFVVDWVTEISESIDRPTELRWMRANAMRRRESTTRALEELRKQLGEKQLSLAQTEAELAEIETEISGKPVAPAQVEIPSLGDKVLDQLQDILRTTAIRYGVAVQDFEDEAAKPGSVSKMTLADLTHASAELKALERVAATFLGKAVIEGIVKQGMELGRKHD